jgi:hypothetical protein
MKQKVRILLAYFKGFGVDRVNTYINFDYSSISDWNRIFEDSRGNEIKPPDSIIQILEDLIGYKMKDFHKHNEYDWDEYWTLFINIYPKENRINFQSECKFQTEENYKMKYDLQSSDEMSRTGDNDTLPQQILDQIDATFNTEISEEDFLVTFSFDGSYDEIYVEDVYVDRIANTRKQPWVNLLDNILKNKIDRWWNEGPGFSGNVKILKNISLTINGVWKTEDYEMTDMNINVTPDSFE